MLQTFNNVLDTVTDYKYLGIILDEHLTLNKPVVHGEMEWLNCKYRKQLNMLRS